jgi:hypothetical protein
MSVPDQVAQTTVRRQDPLTLLRSRGRLRGTAALLGPAFVTAVAYIDPGNFATNIAAGAGYGYALAWVVVAANLTAMLVQYLSAKVGVATGKDLPELCREHRRFELTIGGLLGMVSLGFCYDLAAVGADPGGAAAGLIPAFSGRGSLLIAGIIGATVMPHAVYLHSALTKSRVSCRDDSERRELLHFQRLDVVLALVNRRITTAAAGAVAAVIRRSQRVPAVGDVPENDPACRRSPGVTRLDDVLAGSVCPPLLMFTSPMITADDHVLGPASAPVSVIEYGDYECPYCRGAARDVHRLLDRYPDMIRFAFRNFPIPQLHPHAEQAAEAAEAAAAQGKFWAMYELLLRPSSSLDLNSLVGYAERTGLDTGRFISEVTGNVYTARIQRDVQEGVRNGVNATPKFYVDGTRIDGHLPLEGLVAAVGVAVGRITLRSPG